MDNDGKSTVQEEFYECLLEENEFSCQCDTCNTTTKHKKML